MSYKKYDKYKDSGIEWIGEIPEHWEVSKIKYISEFLNGYAFNSDNYTKIGIPIIRIGDISDEINFENTKKVPMDYLKLLYKYIINYNDVLLALTGATIGKACLYTYDKKALLNQRVAILRGCSIHQKFLYFFIISDMVGKQIELFCNGGAQENIGKPEIGNIKIPYPPLHEQKAIANFLDKKTSEIDNLIKDKEKLIKLLNEKRQAIITEATTKGLNKNVKFKDSGIEWIGEIPEHWEVKKIRHMTRVKRGASPRPIDDPKYFDEEGEYGWVRISDVTKSKMYLETTEQKLSELGSNCSVKLNPNELFVSICATVGKPCISKIKCCIHDGFVYFPDYRGDIKYMYYIFESGRPYLGLGKIGTQLNLNTDTIGNIYIPYPNLDEQKAIANFLDKKTSEIDDLIKDLKKSIELLKEYKKSLIYEATTGKIKIN